MSFSVSESAATSSILPFVTLSSSCFADSFSSIALSFSEISAFSHFVASSASAIVVSPSISVTLSFSSFISSVDSSVFVSMASF